MKAYLFSIGETTTDISKWSLERAGLQVHLLYDPKTTLYQKYQDFLSITDGQSAVVRVDADVIFNRNLNEFIRVGMEDFESWWLSGQVYCYLKHDLIYGGINLIKRPALEAAKKRIHEFSKDSRPETRLTRIPEFYYPRRFKNYDMFIGVHGYKQSKPDVVRVMKQKDERDQLKDWDWSLINRMNKL